MTSTQEQAQEAAAQAKDKAGEAAQQARGRVRDQVDQRSTEAGERVSAQATDVRSVADALRDQGQDKPAELADKAAHHAERFGGYLKDADADRILGDLEDLGRRQPMAVVFGGLALGFVASRFLKASSQQRSEAASASVRNGGSDLTAARPALPRTTPAPLVSAPPVSPRPDTLGSGGVATGGPAGAPFPDPVVETDPRVPAPRTAGGL